MNHFKCNTDGPDGHYGLACSLELGVARGITKHMFHLLFLSMIVMCMGSPMSLQIPLHMSDFEYRKIKRAIQKH